MARIKRERTTGISSAPGRSTTGIQSTPIGSLGLKVGRIGGKRKFLPMAPAGKEGRKYLRTFGGGRGRKGGMGYHPLFSDRGEAGRKGRARVRRTY